MIQQRDEISRVFSSPIEVARREFLWEIILLLFAVVMSLVGLLYPHISTDAGTRVVGVFSVNLVVLAVLLNLHFQRYKKLLTEKTEKVDERVSAVLQGYKAIRAILESDDDLFKGMASQAVAEQFAYIENAEVQYVIPRHPMLLRDSISQAINKEITAVYYIDEHAHATYWDSRVMENYLAVTTGTAKKNKVKFRRLFVVSREQLVADPNLWPTIHRIMNMQKSKGIQTFATVSDRYFSDVLEKKSDLVIIKGARVHQHYRKGSEGFRYTTALLITGKSKVARIEQLVDSAIAEAIPLSADSQAMLEDILAHE